MKNHEVKTQDPARTRQLIVQFPAIEELLKSAGYFNTTAPLRTMDIKVRLADENLLDYRPGVGYQTCKERPEEHFLEDVLVATAIIAHERELHCVNQLVAPQSPIQFYHPKLYRVHSLSDMIMERHIYEDMPMPYIVILKMVKWFPGTRHNRSAQPTDAKLGTLTHPETPLHVEAIVTVYREPKGGFKEMVRNRDFWTSVRIDSDHLDEIEQEPIYPQVQKELTRLVTIIQERLWNAGGLRDLVLNSSHAGWSGRFGSTRVSLYNGRDTSCCIRFTDDGSENAEYIVLEMVQGAREDLELKRCSATMATIEGIVADITQGLKSSAGTTGGPPFRPDALITGIAALTEAQVDGVV